MSCLFRKLRRLAVGLAAALPLLAAAAGLGAVAPVPPLLNDEGDAWPAATRLHAAEAAAGASAPGWATRAQMAQLRRLHPSRVVLLGAGATPAAAGRASLRGAWVFVAGGDAAAVRLARRVAAGPAAGVWVLLPARPAAASSRSAP